jgi:hypothetical protein
MKSPEGWVAQWPHFDGSTGHAETIQCIRMVQEDAIKELVELLRSARCIAERKGEGTAWERFSDSIAKAGIGSVTARTYRVLPSDPHVHENNGVDDKCAKCGEDLRSEIHIRL